MELFLFGTNYKRTGAEQRESLAFVEEDIPDALAEIIAIPEISEACIVSTCNRVEFYICAREEVCVPRLIRQYYQRARDLDIREFTHQFYYLKNKDAVRHLFRVIASLDSMVLGEVDIIHQVKRMYQLCVAAGANGLVLDRAFHQTFMLAKKARSETKISEGSMSVAMVAVEHVQRLLGGLEGLSATVVGAGQMSIRMARYLNKRGIASLTIANRTRTRVLREAERLRASVVDLDGLRGSVAETDVVMIAIDYGHRYLWTTETLERIAADRGGRPLTVVDISVPRVVEPAEDPPDGVTILDLDDFDPILQENKRRRQAAVADVEALIDTFVDRFATWRHEAVILPDVIRLRKMVKRMCTEEIERHAAEIPQEAIPAVRKLTEALSERIIKTPIQSLKSQIYEMDPHEPLTDFRRLFNLAVVEPEDDAACRSEEVGHPETCEMCAPTGSCVMSRHESQFAS